MKSFEEGDSVNVLVFSDSHGRVQPMLDAVERYRPDVAFHLGDVVRDAEELRRACPRLTLYQVRGNCDYGAVDCQTEGVARLEGKTIFYLHGHTRQVKSGIDLAVAAARTAGADILLFGHTHRSLCQRYGEVLAVNPGAILDGRYALLTWDAGGEVKVLPSSDHTRG